MLFSKNGKGCKKMIKVRTKNCDESRNESILSKRKLDYRYLGFSSSASRPPIASPDLEENIGVKKDEKGMRSSKKKQRKQGSNLTLLSGI